MCKLNKYISDVKHKKRRNNLNFKTFCKNIQKRIKNKIVNLKVHTKI
jgi:hypothetical protein